MFFHAVKATKEGLVMSSQTKKQLHESNLGADFYARLAIGLRTTAVYTSKDQGHDGRIIPAAIPPGCARGA
jgi:hypothetical protein